MVDHLGGKLLHRNVFESMSRETNVEMIVNCKVKIRKIFLERNLSLSVLVDSATFRDAPCVGWQPLVEDVKVSGEATDNNGAGGKHKAHHIHILGVPASII